MNISTQSRVLKSFRRPRTTFSVSRDRPYSHMVKRYFGCLKTLLEMKKKSPGFEPDSIKIGSKLCYFFRDNTFLFRTSLLFKLASNSLFSSIPPSLRTYLA